MVQSFRFEHHTNNGCPQIFPGENEAGQEDQAEQADPPVGAHEDRQHHQVQCQEAPLEEDEAEDVNLHFLQTLFFFSFTNGLVKGLKSTLQNLTERKDDNKFTWPL